MQDTYKTIELLSQGYILERKSKFHAFALEEVERYRREVAGHNMSVVALQSLVFGVKDVALFGGKYSASD